MAKKTRGEKFRELFHYWLGYFGFDMRKIPISQDNRGDSNAVVWYYTDNTLHVRYNSKKLARKPISFVYGAVFHEIGHILQDLSCKTEEEEIYSELCAEIFSITMMKRHYPKLYKDSINYHKKMLKSRNWKKNWPIHLKAFKQIREYN